MTRDEAQNLGDKLAQKMVRHCTTLLKSQKVETHVTVIVHVRADTDPQRPNDIALMTVGASTLSPLGCLPIIHHWAEDQIAKLATPGDSS